MTESDLLLEEIKEQQAEIFRLKRSFNKADNGVKLHRIDVLSRTVGRLEDALKLAKREVA